MKKIFFFVDESWDPNFYSKKWELIVWSEWCSSILQLWLTKTENPHPIRKSLLDLQNEILKDEYFNWIPSVEKRRNKFYFHAKDDIPEIREKVFKLIKTLDIKVYIIVARKIEWIFKNKHNSDPEVFYNSMVMHLFKNQIQNWWNWKNIIYFEKRWSKTKQKPLEDSIKNAIGDFEIKHNCMVNSNFEVLVQIPSDEPCLQVADYVNWVVQRAFIKKEIRYYNFIKEKIHLIWDIYDKDNYPNSFYTQHKNPFDIKKISPIETI